jgi:predicted RND superfamily exporter protein
MDIFKKIYKGTILNHPKMALTGLVFITLFFAAFIPQFRLDASSDALLLEGDKSLHYYRKVKEQYGSDDYLVVTYTPKGALFNGETLQDLGALRDELAAIKRVKSATSILDVPLINSPPVDIEQFKDNPPTLLSPQTNMMQAREELMTSPLYSELLISKDGETTAVMVTFAQDQKGVELLKKRTALREKERTDSLSAQESESLAAVEKDYAAFSRRQQEKEAQDIAEIRDIVSKHEENATIHLGGVKMIAVDSMEYVRSDLIIFGIAVLCFIVVLLTLFFRKIHWVLLPIVNCVTVGVIMLGLLGLVGWPVTVVSSNFISLLLIFTLSFSVHQIVRYREYHAAHPDDDQYTLVSEATLKIIIPCLFMVVTTIVAFGSLVVSGIRPVIDFGWIMSVGLGVSFLVSFTLFPAVLMFLKKPQAPAHFSDRTAKVTQLFARSIEAHGRAILMSAIIVIITVGAGVSMLTVENRFVDYYKDSTEIHQGMSIIDKKLGGTVPLDIIFDAPPQFLAQYEKKKQAFIAERKADDPNYRYEPFMGDGYWMISPRREMKNIHEYIDSLPQTGKVLSFHTTRTMAGDIDAQVANTIMMAVMKDKLPGELRDMLFDSYVSPDGNQLRFSARIYETDKSLKRDAFIKEIEHHLKEEMGLGDRVHITGMLVLYNNVLQSLFDSQIKTIWTVFITIFVMFTILFRSPLIAAVAFLPNITITALVLGIMGWLHIPLDIMTITIAAICTGSADDNTIHYVHRFQTEFKKHGDYWKAVHASHESIGRAMYYTSITVMFGFSLLMFSNFVPTIYFGLLVAFAMFLALLANLVLLPLLLVMFKPMGKGK